MNREARIQFLEKIRELAGEHANAFVFIANVDMDEDDNQECILQYYEGGRSQAIGLMETIKEQLLTEIRHETAGPDDDDSEEDQRV